MALYVDRILRDAKPNDVPVDQPLHFELVVDLKTAQRIGVSIPQSVLNPAEVVLK